jgi:uncharacterized protein (UPF0276 family)
MERARGAPAAKEARMIPVGLLLPPEHETLELLGPLIAEADYYEVAPETLWRALPDGRLEPNGFHRRFQALRHSTGKPFVAHGVGYSVGTVSPADAARRRRWLRRIRADQEVFGFRWYTDHLGATSLDGLALTLPLPVPMTADSAAVVRRRLRSLRRIVPRVGVETTASYFVLGDPLQEPLFLNRIAREPGFHFLLDLHNVYTMGLNFGFDPLDYLARLDLARVIEIHLSGGSQSDPRWLPSGRSLRLDSHDASVPEPVWALLESVLPRCPGLEGITLERLEGTLASEQVPELLGELLRARRLGARLP